MARFAAADGTRQTDLAVALALRATTHRAGEAMAGRVLHAPLAGLRMIKVLGGTDADAGDLI
jgi:hypothetical protein